jgi:SAM-dependent methyltransferase
MDDWIGSFGPGQRVLDLGSGAGSFPPAWFRATLVWLDEDLDAFGTAPEVPPGAYYRVFGSSGRLPFAARSFDLVICHHALEHIADPAATLREVARVLQPGGQLYIAVPDGYTLSDGLYRFLFEGGGHVNRFRRRELVALVQETTGLALARWQNLYSSFNYLDRLRRWIESPSPGLSRRLRIVARLPPAALTAWQWALYVFSRAADRLLGTRLSSYGWALFFSPGAARAVETPGYVNVCLCCGMGEEAAKVQRHKRVAFVCSNCHHINPYCRPFGTAQ